MRPVATFGRYLFARFGFPVRKIPLSIPGLTCPNIDGTLGRGGCTYCENESFSPNLKEKSRFFLSPKTLENPLIERQIEALTSQYLSTAKALKKQGFRGFIAYFQSFSNTYAPVETLKRLYERALRLPGCVGLSIGTRADCITQESLDYLADLARRTELWVEIGVQSSHDKTLDLINRCERFEAVAQMIGRLRERNIRVCAHLIFGLPAEDGAMMLETLRRVVALGVESIKIHPLYVVKNTALAASLRAGGFEPMDEETYLALVTRALAQLPEGIIVQRVSAGIDDESLLAPSWCRNKNRVMGKLRARLLKEGLNY
ncbi:MAG: TIGR01212 family radical SAM protein [Campylobacterales bacterium]